MHSLAGYSMLMLLAGSAAFAQPKQATTPAQRAASYFTGVNQQVLDMAKDFPEDKYGYKLSKEMRSFGDVIVHVASGNIYGSKAGRGEQVKWDELDPANYKTKAEIVALLQNSIDDATAAMKASPEGPKKNLEPWLAVMQHSSEHYGLLVAYYRANGMVPPASRPKK